MKIEVQQFCNYDKSRQCAGGHMTSDCTKIFDPGYPM
jgi:hypothetical protein